MKPSGAVVFYMNIISPHQIPLAREVARCVGFGNFRFIYAERFPADRAKMGWTDDSADVTCLSANTPDARDWLESADFMLTGVRDLDLFERRGTRGLKTFYTSERWFRPTLGRFRMLHPTFRRMAHRFVSLIRKGFVTYLPCGVWAARDMAWLCARGEERRKIFESLNRHGIWQPMESVGCDWMRMWGYFVAPSSAAKPRRADASPECAVRVLWVGRLLALKRVDTLLRAIAACLEKIPIELTLVGDGPERDALELLGRRLFKRHPTALDFRHSVPIAEVRTLMRSHDVYILPSNGYEGWGAVVNEALEEGMIVFGSRQAGACATMLDESHLFDAGDVHAMSRLLGKARTEFKGGEIGPWSAASGAARLLKEVEFHV